MNTGENNLVEKKKNVWEVEITGEAKSLEKLNNIRSRVPGQGLITKSNVNTVGSGAKLSSFQAQLHYLIFV